MKGKDVVLRKDECYCCLYDFYKTVAKKLDISVTDDTFFDCQRVNVTPEVQNELWSYYEKEEGMEAGNISMLFLFCGPKANINNSGKNLYLARVFEKFVTGDAK